MKQYTMLKTVQGSRDGIKVETFAKGETHELDAHLAEQFYHQGAVEEVAAGVEDDSAPNLREGARDRSTKVTGPVENKVTGPAETKEGEAGVDLDTQHIEELTALARDAYGLEVDSTMDEATLRELIRGAQAAASGTDDAKGEGASTKKSDAKPVKKK